MNSVEEKIIDILFKDLIIADVLVDSLLPERIWVLDKDEVLRPEYVYDIARDELKHNLKKMLEK